MKRLVALAAVVCVLAVGAPVGAFTISGTFTDDDGSVHEPAIQAIAELGITNGCGPALFCPADQVTRQQMASFLVRALDLSPLSSGPFTDLLPNVHAGDINALAAAGITVGCDTDLFCPLDPVRRDQMASFLARAFDLPPGPDAGFLDLPAINPHVTDINAIAAAGITLGCGAGLYCPTDPVLRGQMASFLTRSLDVEPSYVRLPLYEGLPLSCTKDGLICSAAFSIPYRTTYRIDEGLYQMLPATSTELGAFRSQATRVEIVLDGLRLTLPRGAEIETADRLSLPFTRDLTLTPGAHTLIATWFLDGGLIQTVQLNLEVG